LAFWMMRRQMPLRATGGPAATGVSGEAFGHSD
jgi:hypothetical protein